MEEQFDAIVIDSRFGIKDSNFIAGTWSQYCSFQGLSNAIKDSSSVTDELKKEIYKSINSF